MEAILESLAVILVFGFGVLAALAPWLLLERIWSARWFGVACPASSCLLVVCGFAWIGLGAMDGTSFDQRFMYELMGEANFGALFWGVVGAFVLVVDGVGRFVDRFRAPVA